MRYNVKHTFNVCFMFFVGARVGLQFYPSVICH